MDKYDISLGFWQLILVDFHLKDKTRLNRI